MRDPMKCIIDLCGTPAVVHPIGCHCANLLCETHYQAARGYFDRQSGSHIFETKDVEDWIDRGGPVYPPRCFGDAGDHWLCVLAEGHGGDHWRGDEADGEERPTFVCPWEVPSLFLRYDRPDACAETFLQACACAYARPANRILVGLYCVAKTDEDLLLNKMGFIATADVFGGELYPGWTSAATRGLVLTPEEEKKQGFLGSHMGPWAPTLAEACILAVHELLEGVRWPDRRSA